ncbi:MAG: hypothetical protein DWI02_02180 [Planctomycetota bacterium]|nr:MAG: hypothetical protein DWI02_02180 [Planctomycetota bacterium]
MVVVTVLSMISFLFLDDFGRGKGPTSPLGGALIIGCLCAAAMCIIGYTRQKTTEFGIGGFLIGCIVGYIGFGAIPQNKPLVRTSVGNLNRQDFEQMARKRQRANYFLQEVARRTESGSSSSFGGIDDQSLLNYRVHSADAQKMGIRISDEGVNEFLKQISRGRLTAEDFKESLRESRLGESELFDTLKEELSAQLAIQLMEPPAFTATAPPGLAQYVQNREPLRYMQSTPQQLWESFQMLNLKQSLQAVAIPVQEFVSEVGEPSATELDSLFKQFSNRRWIDEAQPGFVQLPRVKLAYLTADFEKFERRVDPSSDEIREYYEKNKDRYRAPAAKESTAPQLPDGEKVIEPETKTKPEAEPVAPASETPEAPATPQEGDEKPAKPTEPAATPEEKAATPEPKTPEPKTESEPKSETEQTEKPGDKVDSEPKSESGCAADETETPKPAASEEVKVDEKPAAEVTPEPTPEKVPTPAKAEEPVATEPTPAAPAAAAAEEVTGPAEPPATEAETTPAPPLSQAPVSLPEPKFRELDEELRLEIRETLMRERAFFDMAAALDKAFDAMLPWGLDYDTSTDEDQKEEKAKAVAEKMKQYAITHQLEYVETPEWEYEALVAEPIGMAVEEQGRTNVANEVMMRGERGEPRIPLYAPRRADSRNRRGSFAYWKITDIPAKIPSLDEEPVREKVVKAWKFDQARRLAEDRAISLVDKTKKEGSNLAATISGESATGRKTDPALSVIETPEFTWLSTPQSVPSGPQDPMITDIPLIAKASNDFMKKVFEDLKEGDIGVAANGDRSIYYIVKVVGRELVKEDGGVARQEKQRRFLAERFSGLYPIIKSPYESLAQLPQRVIDQTWRQNFMKRLDIDWDDEAVQVPAPRRQK